MKNFFFTVLLFLLPFLVGAQNRIEVSYVSLDSVPEVTMDLMNFLDVKYMKMNVHGDIKGKKWKLWAREVNEGEIKSEAVFPYVFEFSDTLAVFTFMAQDKNDSVYVTCKTPNYSSGKNKYAINTASGAAYPTPYILMETIPLQDYTTADEINLVAYTSGIKQNTTMGRYNFCELRNAKADPKHWQTKYKLPRFVYFSLRLE